MTPRLLCLLLLLCAACAACAPAHTPADPASSSAGPPTRTTQDSGTDALFIGVSPVNERVVWLAGTGGTYARTTDGGATWQAAVVPGADSLQFRDVHAVDADTAYLLSIGPGAQSRIYKTTDGGASWQRSFTNDDPDAFFDCLAFWDADHGLAFSDSVEGTFVIITTADGGATWQRVPADALPPAAEGEGSFAASGTCVTTHGDGIAWIGTGNAAPARVLRTDDRGRTWTHAEVPVVAGEAKGLASVPFRDAMHGLALGGDIAAPTAFADNVARTTDGGRTWQAAARTPFPGAVYGAAWVPGTHPPHLVAVGPGGAAVTRDDGRTWAVLDTLTYWSVGAAAPGAVWTVGPQGRVTRLAFE